MCRNVEMCRIPPPPPVWDLRDSRRWWRSGKKCRSPPPPPPPPPLISFFGTCATFEAGGGPKKTSVLCPPPFFLNPGSAPALAHGLGKLTLTVITLLLFSPQRAIKLTDFYLFFSVLVTLLYLGPLDEQQYGCAQEMPAENWAPKPNAHARWQTEQKEWHWE